MTSMIGISRKFTVLGTHHFIEPELITGCVHIGFPYIGRVYSLCTESCTERQRCRINKSITVAVGLKRMDSLSREEGGPAGHAKRRRTVAALENNAPVRECLHVGRLDGCVTVRFCVEWVVLIRHEYENIRHVISSSITLKL